MTSFTMILETAPTAQRRMSYKFEGGSLVIGRDDDADWQIDDPEMYLSRKHCVIAASDGKFTATDASRGGTFVDGAQTPLGTGNSVSLEDGMRLRMGDFVFRIDMAATDQPTPKPAATSTPARASFTFAEKPVADDPKTERPETLPPPFDPFGQEKPTDRAKPDKPKPPKPFGMDDPFGLDLAPRSKSEPSPPTSGGGFFDAPLHAPVTGTPTPEPEPAPTPKADVAPTQPSTKGQATEVPNTALRDALFEGMGLDPKQYESDDPAAQMEAIGQQYRYLVDGVMHLLRARASAKQQVRVAQTLIANANVNPLKFLATTDDAMATMIEGDRPGYLTAPDAIVGAYRDLADHQLRTWKALQSALRRMIDQFDPKQIEAEIADSGLLESLLAGGKSAQLWSAYEDRYQDIARAAEERFLGEVGENFRDAYEGKEENPK